MTAKRKSHHRIPPWLRLLDPLDFEIVTPLPIDTAADRLYQEFGVEIQRKGPRTEYKDIQRQVLDEQTLRIKLELEINMDSRKERIDTKLIAVGYLKDIGATTQFNGVSCIAPVHFLVVMLITTAALGAGWFFVFGPFTSTVSDSANPLSFLLTLILYILFFLLIIAPWRRHRRLRLEFVETLKYILTDERKTK